MGGGGGGGYGKPDTYDVFMPCKLYRKFTVKRAKKKACKPAHMAKLTKGMCAQRRLKSVWASAHSDQNLRCSHEESWSP